jgi:hypothetical protein
MTFTGIPPAVTDFNYHKEHAEIMQAMPGTIVAMMVEILDQREMGGGELTMRRIKTEIFDPWEKRLDVRLKSFSISGSIAQQEKRPETKQQTIFDWGNGQIRTVPKSYALNTKLSCRDMWICWHLGEERKGTLSNKLIEYTSPPWKFLTIRDLSSAPAMKTYLSNMKYLGTVLDQAAGLTSLSHPTLAELNGLFKASAVQDVLWQACATTTGRQRRIDQVKWETLAQALRKNGAASAVAPTASSPTKKSAPTKKRKATQTILPPGSDNESVLDVFSSTDKGRQMHQMHSLTKAEGDSEKEEARLQNRHRHV